MKYALFAALSIFAAYASAGEPAHTAAATQAPVVEHYNYAQDLDIAKVIKIGDAAQTQGCEPVPVQMTYQDSKGATHTLEYTRMSEGCENG